MEVPNPSPPAAPESEDAAAQERLSGEIAADFPEIERVVVVRAGAGASLALLRAKSGTAAKDLALRVALRAAERGQVVFPAPLAGVPFDRLSASPAIPAAASTSTGPERLVKLMAALRAAPGDAALRHLERVHRAADGALSDLRRSGRLPASTLFFGAADVVGRLLAHALAYEGRAFGGALPDFAGLPPPCPVSARDLALYFALRGIALGEELLFDAGLPEQAEALPWAEIEALLDRFHRWVAGVVMPPAEHRRRRRRALVIAGGAVALALFLVLLLYLRSRPPAPVDESRVVAPGGIWARFYSDREQQQLLFERATPGIDFRAPGGAILPDLPRENYSVRWEGYLQFPELGDYAICVERDDGARVFFRDELLVDAWQPGGVRPHCGRVTVRPGWYPIRVDYVHRGGAASIRVVAVKDGRRPSAMPAQRWCCTKQP